MLAKQRRRPRLPPYKNTLRIRTALLVSLPGQRYMFNPDPRCAYRFAKHILVCFYMAPKVGIEPTTNWLTANCTTSVLLRNGIWSRIHGVKKEGTYLNFCPVAAFSANNTFLTPTGPTYSRIVAFAKPGKSLPGRFPSTHLTKCCLSIWRRRRESNSPKSDRQSGALPENYYGKNWSAW